MLAARPDPGLSAGEHSRGRIASAQRAVGVRWELFCVVGLLSGADRLMPARISLPFGDMCFAMGRGKASLQDDAEMIIVVSVAPLQHAPQFGMRGG